jgi:hypothetical protein
MYAGDMRVEDMQSTVCSDMLNEIGTWKEERKGPWLKNAARWSGMYKLIGRTGMIRDVVSHRVG